MRLDHDVQRGAAITIVVDGVAIPTFEGETIATAMIASGRSAFRRDQAGRPRGLYCNMGTCSECLVAIGNAGRRRACLTPVQEGMEISTND